MLTVRVLERTMTPPAPGYILAVATIIGLRKTSKRPSSHLDAITPAETIMLEGVVV